MNERSGLSRRSFLGAGVAATAAAVVETSPSLSAQETANIAAFHDSVVRQNFENATVAVSVRSNLITILGRTAAYRGGLVTWNDLLAANERLEADLKGLKA